MIGVVMPPIRSTPSVVLTPPTQSEAQSTQDNTTAPREQPTTQQSTTQRADHFDGPQETGRPGASFTDLQREGDTARHIEHTSDRVQLRDNFSLARAIEYGAAQHTNP